MYINLKPQYFTVSNQAGADARLASTLKRAPKGSQPRPGGFPEHPGACPRGQPAKAKPSQGQAGLANTLPQGSPVLRQYCPSVAGAQPRPGASGLSKRSLGSSSSSSHVYVINVLGNLGGWDDAAHGLLPRQRCQLDHKP